MDRVEDLSLTGRLFHVAGPDMAESRRPIVVLLRGTTYMHVLHGASSTRMGHLHSTALPLSCTAVRTWACWSCSVGVGLSFRCWAFL